MEYKRLLPTYFQIREGIFSHRKINFKQNTRHNSLVCNKSYTCSYCLGSKTTAALFYPRTALLPKASGKQNQTKSCCCLRSKSIIVLFCTCIFCEFYWLFIHMSIRCFGKNSYTQDDIYLAVRVSVNKLITTTDVKITWPMKIRLSVNSLKEGKRSIN